MDEPEGYRETLGALPEDVSISTAQASQQT